MSIEHSIRYYSWRFFSFQSISVCPKYQPSLSKGMLDIMTLLLHSAPRQLRAGWQRQWLWQFQFHNDSDNFKWNENDKDEDNASQQGCQEFRDDTPSARIRSLWSHCTFPACPNAQMPTQMPGLLTQIPKLCPPRCTTPRSPCCSPKCFLRFIVSCPIPTDTTGEQQNLL